MARAEVGEWPTGVGSQIDGCAAGRGLYEPNLTWRTARGGVAAAEERNAAFVNDHDDDPPVEDPGRERLRTCLGGPSSSPEPQPIYPGRGKLPRPTTAVGLSHCLARLRRTAPSSSTPTRATAALPR